MSTKRTAVAAALLLAAAPIASAHTWVEYLYRINAAGSFTGEAGYPIGYVPRAQGVPDDIHQNKILDTSTNPVVCKPLSSSNDDKYPPIKASAGDYIAMQYQENGHVTQPDQTVRPYRGGNVYVYGTLHHKDSDGINDVLNSWTVDGKGGNGKGRLLATHYFDDGQCFQDAPGNPIAEERKAKYGVDELYCQTDLQLPSDLPTKGTYTLMWVWNWPRIISNTQNVTEIYTTCAQVDLSDESTNAHPSIKVAAGDNIQSAAIPSQLHDLIEATALGVGTNSPPAPTGIAEATSTHHAEPATTSASKKHKDGGDGLTTVTVTAEPHTVTQFRTVIMSGGEQMSTPAPTKHTMTAPASSFPTSVVPVTSVQGFLKAHAIRGLRVTGQARREYRP